MLNLKFEVLEVEMYLILTKLVEVYEVDASYSCFLCSVR